MLYFWGFLFYYDDKYSTLDGRVRRAIASDVVDLGTMTSPVKPKTQKLVFTASLFDAHRRFLCLSVSIRSCL